MYFKRFIKGIEISEETLAVDVIDEIGPGGHFWETEHIIKNFRHVMVPNPSHQMRLI